jgi:hypothetical protein
MTWKSRRSIRRFNDLQEQLILVYNAVAEPNRREDHSALAERF